MGSFFWALYIGTRPGGHVHRDMAPVHATFTDGPGQTRSLSHTPQQQTLGIAHVDTISGGRSPDPECLGQTCLMSGTCCQCLTLQRQIQAVFCERCRRCSSCRWSQRPCDRCNDQFQQFPGREQLRCHRWRCFGCSSRQWLNVPEIVQRQISASSLWRQWRCLVAVHHGGTRPCDHLHGGLRPCDRLHSG